MKDIIALGILTCALIGGFWRFTEVVYGCVKCVCKKLRRRK